MFLNNIILYYNLKCFNTIKCLFDMYIQTHFFDCMTRNVYSLLHKSLVISNFTFKNGGLCREYIVQSNERQLECFERLKPNLE